MHRAFLRWGFWPPTTSIPVRLCKAVRIPQDIISIKFGQNAPFHIAHRKHLGQSQFCQHFFRLEERARRFNTYSCAPNAVYGFLQRRTSSLIPYNAFTPYPESYGYPDGTKCSQLVFESWRIFMGTSLSLLSLAFLVWTVTQQNMGLLIYVDLNPLPSFLTELSHALSGGLQQYVCNVRKVWRKPLLTSSTCAIHLQRV